MATKPGPSMRKVAEGIYQRPSGKYVVPIYDPATGKKRWSHPDMPRGGFASLDVAREFKRDREAEKRRRESSGETCDQLADRWADDYQGGRGITTTQHYRERVKAFGRDFDGMPVDRVNRQLARLWVQGGSVPTRYERLCRSWEGAHEKDGRLFVPAHPSHYRTVRTMFNDLVQDGTLERNPFSALRTSQPKGRADIVTLTGDELGLLVETAADVWKDYGEQIFGPFVQLAANTGMRPGELFALRWPWVDFENDDLHVKRQLQTRTGLEVLPGRGDYRARVVPLLPDARAALQAIREADWPRQDPDDEHVMVTQQGRPYTQRVHHYYWNPVRAAFWSRLPEDRQHDIPRGFDFYELRHWFGTRLQQLGATPYDIADAMGHKDGGALAMRLYIHNRSDEARDRIKSLARQQQIGLPRTRRAGS